MTASLPARHSLSHLAKCYQRACEAELAALKPGNVGLERPAHGMSAEAFRISAQASAQPLADPHTDLGERIYRAVAATWEKVAKNTNLGIVLACAPLAQAAGRTEPAGLRRRTAAVLTATTIQDAVWAYRGIRLATPAGLGRSKRLDVGEEPDRPLQDAMAEASHWDRLAAAYCNDFEEVFAYALPRLHRLIERWEEEAWALTGVYLGLLGRAPDSHVARKHGSKTAEAIREQAEQMAAELDRCEEPQSLAPMLREADTELREGGINPGTCADLTVATAFAWRLLQQAELAGTSLSFRPGAAAGANKPA